MPFDRPVMRATARDRPHTAQSTAPPDVGVRDEPEQTGP